MLLAVEDLNHAWKRARRFDFRIARLEIAGKVRKEGAGDLHADAMTGEEGIAGQHPIQVQASDAVGLEIFGLQGSVTVAGAKNVEARTHQIEGRAVGRHIQETHPKIEISAKGR